MLLLCYIVLLFLLHLVLSKLRWSNPRKSPSQTHLEVLHTRSSRIRAVLKLRAIQIIHSLALPPNCRGRAEFSAKAVLCRPLAELRYLQPLVTVGLCHRNGPKPQHLAYQSYHLAAKPRASGFTITSSFNAWILQSGWIRVRIWLVPDPKIAWSSSHRLSQVLRRICRPRTDIHRLRLI